MITPSKKDFLQFAKEGKTVPLYEEIPFTSPQSLYALLRSSNTVLLESVKGPAKIARYSFIGFDPHMTFKAKNGLIEIADNSNPACLTKRLGGESLVKNNISSSKPLQVLKDILKAYRQEHCEYLPPFQGGIVGVLSYDFVQYLERLPQDAIDDLHIPDAHFFFIDRLIALDHFREKAWVIVCPGVQECLRRDQSQPRIKWSEIYDKAENEVRDIVRRVKDHYQPTIKTNSQFPILNSQSSKIDIIYEMKKNDYMDIVKKAKEYIAAGDIFQSNLSQRVSAYIGDKSPWRLYEILSSINPSPFAAFIDFGDYQIVSSSPERLIRVNDGIIETRPIAGTRPRGKNIKEDELMRIELLLNEKERAEHIMLIDLERNDLGKVSYYGSVMVDELMITEDCSHVMHIVSNIRGNLAQGKDCFDAIKATFPGGTITGVPKVRCMEIIDELEPVRRGPYTGSIGYIGFSGNMDLNIIIRTFVIKDEKAYVQVGAGIVADSDPEREYYETLKKAEALIRTLESV
jgi:anthranilate/para-aminobenzoate synthase component I